MEANAWLVFSIVAALAILALAVLLVRRKKGEQSEPDYRVFFILGICWIPMGISTENPAFTVLGVVFMALGLANRHKWPDEEPLTRNKRRAAYALALVTGLLVLALIVAKLYGQFAQ